MDPNVQADLSAYTRNEAAYLSESDIMRLTAQLEGMAITSPMKRPYPADSAPQCLDIPLLLAEYKKLSDDFSLKGVNQARMYGIATAKFLSVLGIEDFPVFTLVTEGSLGVVTCTHSHTLTGPVTRRKRTRVDMFRFL